jgi:hypothetical protein
MKYEQHTQTVQQGLDQKLIEEFMMILSIMNNASHQTLDPNELEKLKELVKPTSVTSLNDQSNSFSPKAGSPYVPTQILSQRCKENNTELDIHAKRKLSFDESPCPPSKTPRNLPDLPQLPKKLTFNPHRL